MCKSRMLYYGLKLKGDIYVCEACGSDQLKSTMHLDYADKAETHMQCQQCQAMAKTVYKRTKKERLYWED